MKYYLDIQLPFVPSAYLSVSNVINFSTADAEKVTKFTEYVTRKTFLSVILLSSQNLLILRTFISK
jgi:hypothetical protein